MQVLRQPVPLPPATAACVGAFDGLHLGHQALLRRARELAPHVALVTFDPQGYVRNVDMVRPSRVTVNGSCMAARLRQFSLRAAAGRSLVQESSGCPRKHP